ncbi:hypothetical protein F53441_13499 [Fusarium austroafricanum]|uniref:HTH CENPB-type domain-containing protein n=1 Tax=Fusarium austroafricanum TaxID=2364996 RepID=A0A8H4JNR9_9HYPO|nr:hypothetical protein F53441_13499 [Fusarium austroafricanum]
MHKWTEEDMSAALLDVSKGVSINKAALCYGINRSTLQDRVKGRGTSQEHNKRRQKLSEGQEKKLMDWILIQDNLGCPVNHQQVRAFASKIAVRNGYPDGVGKNWLQSFLRRYPEVSTLRGKKIDIERYNGANTELIKAFFALLMLPDIRKIRQENRYNVDEVGMMEGIGLNGLVLGHSEKKEALLKQPGSRSWISILECISATGKVLTPLVIFKGKTVQQQYFPADLDFLNDWKFSCSPKGWTNNHLAFIWLKTVFIPQTKPEKEGEWRLLILDGHGSHMTEEFLWECYENKIFLLFLPAHSSHVLQPLDVAIFGPLKRLYRRYISDLAAVADCSTIGKISFLRNYYKARLEAISKNNIRAGFRATGLWPVNMTKPLMNPMVTETKKTPVPPVIPISPAKRKKAAAAGDRRPNSQAAV